MTFASYRHLLRLEPAPRHPEEAESPLVEPFGVLARHGETVAGMALAEAPLRADGVPQVLSLFVEGEWRRQGIGTRLLAWVEEEAARRGFASLGGVYTTNRPATAALERIFARLGWSPPTTRMLLVRFSPEKAKEAPWFRRISLRPRDVLFDWVRLTDAERAALREGQGRRPWIPEGLEPWRYDTLAHLDRGSSVGLRHDGDIVGWVLNHRLSDGTVRFTCSHVRADLARLGRILPLYDESIERLARAGVSTCHFTTPAAFGPMTAFVKDRCAAWTTFIGETRGVSKRLDR